MSDFQKKIFILIFGLLGMIYLIEQHYFHTVKLEQSRQDRESRDRATDVSKEATAVAAKSYRNKEIEGYLSCNLGSSACFKLFPEGAKAVLDAKESSKK